MYLNYGLTEDFAFIQITLASLEKKSSQHGKFLQSRIQVRSPSNRA